jgi:hypothetical protein
MEKTRKEPKVFLRWLRIFLEKFSARRSIRGVMIFLVLFLLVLGEADSYRLEASRKKEQTICFETKIEKRGFACLSFNWAKPDAAIGLPALDFA